MLSNKKMKKNIPISRKVIVVYPDGTPVDPNDHVPEHIANEIRERHLHPEKFARKTLNELLGPSEEDIERKRKRLEDYYKKKRIETMAVKQMAEAAKAKMKEHQKKVLESVQLEINIEDDIEIVE